MGLRPEESNPTETMFKRSESLTDKHKFEHTGSNVLSGLPFLIQEKIVARDDVGSFCDEILSSYRGSGAKSRRHIQQQHKSR